MSYKIYRESPLPEVDWDAIKTVVMKPINAYKNREERIYMDDEHIWFWHDKERKRVCLTHIKSVQKAGLHGFGSMLNIIYKPTKRYIENGKPVDLHLIDVESCEQSPEDLAKMIMARVEKANEKKFKGRKIHKFPGQESQQKTNQSAPEETQ